MYLRTFLMVLMVGSNVVSGPAFAGSKALPKDLIKYVYDARKFGVTDNQILDAAVSVGWPAAIVADAIAYVAVPTTLPPSSAATTQTLGGSDNGPVEATMPATATKTPVATATPSVPVSRNSATLPKGLIQYVYDSKKFGVKDDQILDGAVRAGWPPARVADAIAYVWPGIPIKHPTSSAPPTQPPASSNSGPAAMPATTVGSPTTTTAAATKTPVTTPKPPAPVSGDSESHPDSILGSGVPYDYRIGAGDVLHISVWKEPDASDPSVVVRPDGKITVPLLKEVDVSGLTPTEVEKVIATGLGKVLKEVSESDVTVVVTGIQSKKIYAIGAVKREGPIPYTYRMSIMQAISEAGGLTDYAKRKKIYVFRSDNGRDVKIPFDYDQVLKGENMELNVALLPGDTLVVPH
jgi:polysaccharide export outer membrane protein